MRMHGVRCLLMGGQACVFYGAAEFSRDTDFVQDNLSGSYQVQYSLAAGESGGIGNPAYLKKVEEFADWYRAQPDVIHVNALTDTMKRLNKSGSVEDAADVFRSIGL